MEVTTIARPYAEAVFALADKANALGAWSDVLGRLAAVAADRDMQDAISNPKFSSEQVYGLIASVAGDLSKEINAQVFGVRRNEIFLFSQPRPIRSVHRSEGWTVQTIHQHMTPSLKGSFVPLERSPDVFTWDPI